MHRVFVFIVCVLFHAWSIRRCGVNERFWRLRNWYTHVNGGDTRLNSRFSQIAYNCILMLIAFLQRARGDGVSASTAEIQLLVHIITITKFSLLRRMAGAQQTPFKVCFFSFHLLFFFSWFFSRCTLSFFHFVHSGQHLHFIISIKLCCALNFIAQEE